MIEWQNLNLKVRGNRTAGYRVEATGPARQQGEAAFHGAALAGLGPALKAIRAGRAERATMERVGLGLFQALLPMEVMAAYVTAQSQLEAGQGLRLRLHLPPELDRLPWELVYYPPDYLAASPRISVVRFVDLPGTPAPVETQLPLRVLCLAGEMERAQLSAALAGAREEGLVDVLAARQATAANLGEGQVLHFAGRAGWEAGQGVLFFEGEGGAQPVAGERLAGRLLEAGVRLAVLSAVGPAGEAGGAWEDVARALVRGGLAAAVTVHRPLPEGVGLAFAAGFYRALALGRAVDAAAGEGRRAAIAALGPSWQEGTDWAVPAILMRAPEGQIWRFRGDKAETGPASQPQPPSIEQHVTAFRDAVTIGEISGGTTSISVGGGAADRDLERMRAVAEATALAEGRPFDELLEVPYDLAALRSLLAEAFSPQELYRFCQNHRFLRPVVKEFGPQQGLNEMIDRVIGYCWTRALWGELLGAVEKENPEQYARFEPYLQVSASERASPKERGAAQAGGDPLAKSLAELRQVVRDYARDDKRGKALEQVAALEAAASGEQPDLDAMEAILSWFEEEVPALMGAVLSAILSAESRVEEMGDEMLIEFRERFRRLP